MLPSYKDHKCEDVMKDTEQFGSSKYQTNVLQLNTAVSTSATCKWRIFLSILKKIVEMNAIS